MGASRFFVANLPPNATEKNIADIFQDYGIVQRVELKTKENPVEPESVKVIAFVTLQINPDEVSHCIEALNWQKVKGSKIKVSLAKESFLDRLKREREEAEASKLGKNVTTQNDEVRAEPVLPRNVENTRKTFTEEELNRMDEDDDFAPELMISKKRAASSLHNGKIVIQNFDAAPLHIIEKQKKKKKTATELPDKATTAEQKRKESVNKMNNQYKQNKSVIQQALAGLDGAKSKKIKFSDAEDEDDNAAAQPKFKKSKTELFGSDNEAHDAAIDDFKLKPELFGKKGEKLLQLQSKQSLDPRFKIDAKFVDDDDEGDESNAAADPNTTQTDASNERNWQMGILEQVVGTKINTADDAQKAASKKRMLRFDPAKQEHQKLLRTQETTEQAQPETMATRKKKKGKQDAVADVQINSAAAPEVSKEVFYVVTDTLTQSLKTRGDGFSLLNMFGSEQTHEQLEQRNDELKKVTDAKILVNKLNRNALNPFSYDSSTDDEAADNATTAIDGAAHSGEAKVAQKNAKQPLKLAAESFFIPRNDVRLKEGAKFFKFDRKHVPEEDYEEVRNRLKMLIKTKINKTKKNLMSNSGGNNRNIGHKRRIKGRY